MKEYSNEEAFVHEILIKKPIVEDVEKHLKVEPKSKYNKTERYKAELRQIIVNLMDNPKHRKRIISISENLQLR